MLRASAERSAAFCSAPLLQARRLRCNKRSSQRQCSARAYAAAAAPAATALTLHIDQTSLSFPFTAENGKDLSTALQALLQTFAAKQKAERPQRWKSMEFRLKGNPEANEVEFLEIFCNPNSAATAFDAKVLLTLKTREGVKVTTEGRLSALKADLDGFVAQIS